MNPKYVFTLGQNAESVQFAVQDGVKSIIINSGGLAAQMIKVGDLAEVRLHGMSVFGVRIGEKGKKGNDNFWFQLLQVSAGETVHDNDEE